MLGNDHLEIVTTDEPQQWDETLEEGASYAFYHRSAYHRLAENLGEGRGVMPVFRLDGSMIAFPMLERDVPGASGLKDVTSVRGFAGPVASQEQIPAEIVRRYQDELLDYFRQTGVIAAYARLNPLTTPMPVLQGIGDVVPVGATVSMDLSIPSEVQFGRYRSNLRTEIRKLRKLGYTCEEAGPDRLGDFIRLYHETMRRVGAEGAFFFGQDYFEFLFREMPDVMRIFICKLDGAVAAASVEGVSKGIVEGYMSGTSGEYVRFSPDKLKYDAVREWGRGIGARVYHLGGGVGARKDSLFDFKMGFGGREHVYSTWRHIVDPSAYKDACREAFAGVEPDDSYFPAYRNPNLTREVMSRG